MRSIIASVVILACATMLAMEVGAFVNVRVSAMVDAVSLSSRSAK